MPQFLWDASALTKRYAPEVGSDIVDALFAVGLAVPMVTTYLSYAETCATLRRKHNTGDINAATFAAARGLLKQEVFSDPGFDLMTLNDEAILGGIAIVDQHNLNSSDAAILFAYLRY